MRSTLSAQEQLQPREKGSLPQTLLNSYVHAPTSQAVQGARSTLSAQEQQQPGEEGLLPQAPLPVGAGAIKFKSSKGTLLNFSWVQALPALLLFI